MNAKNMHRISKSLPFETSKAVSAKLFSFAMDCITSLGKQLYNMQIAKGFPANY
jgi:hypothetical protein